MTLHHSTILHGSRRGHKVSLKIHVRVQLGELLSSGFKVPSIGRAFDTSSLSRARTRVRSIAVRDGRDAGQKAAKKRGSPTQPRQILDSANCFRFFTGFHWHFARWSTVEKGQWATENANFKPHRGSRPTGSVTLNVKFGRLGPMWYRGSYFCQSLNVTTTSYRKKDWIRAWHSFLYHSYFHPKVLLKIIWYCLDFEMYRRRSPYYRAVLQSG